MIWTGLIVLSEVIKVLNLNYAQFFSLVLNSKNKAQNHENVA